MRIRDCMIVVSALVCMMIASCSSVHESTMDDGQNRMNNFAYVVIDGWVYRNNGVVNDTLVCHLMYLQQAGPDGLGIPFSIYNDAGYSFDMSLCLTLTLRPGATFDRNGDTLRVPVAAIETGDEKDASLSKSIALGIIGGAILFALVIVGIDTVLQLPITYGSD